MDDEQIADVNSAAVQLTEYGSAAYWATDHRRRAFLIVRMREEFAFLAVAMGYDIVQSREPEVIAAATEAFLWRGLM